MRPLLFVICFAMGVSLMIFSGYLPRSASARNGLGSGSGSAGMTSLSRPDTVLVESPPIPTYVPSSFDRGEPEHQQPSPETAYDQEMADAAPDDAEQFAEQDERDERVKPPVPRMSDSPAPIANAGLDKVFWQGWDELPLNGGGSRGTDLTYVWRQISGPAAVSISEPEQAVTQATGLPGIRDWEPKMYEFELTVTDAGGRRATDQVAFVTLPAPELTLTPPAVRRFELRDGYILAHFQSWITNLDGDEATFKVLSPTRVTLTKVAGGQHEQSGKKTSEGYLTQITIHRDADQAATWHEFLVDTDEEVPGIVQLGVVWEER